MLKTLRVNRPWDCQSVDYSPRNHNWPTIVVREKRQGFTTGSIWMDDSFFIINGHNYLSFQPNMHHHEMASGHHHWYVCSHARPTYCNVCREALSGVTSHGLSCEGKTLRYLIHFELKVFSNKLTKISITQRNSNLGSKGSVHTKLLAIAIQKWVQYPFSLMTANANAIAKNLVWTEPKNQSPLSGLGIFQN